MSSVEIDEILRAKALMDQIGLEKWHFRIFADFLRISSNHTAHEQFKIV